jgi:hypothetical protein
MFVYWTLVQYGKKVVLGRKSEIRNAETRNRRLECWNAGMIKGWNIGVPNGLIEQITARSFIFHCSNIPLFQFTTPLRLGARYIKDSSKVVRFCYANSTS